MYLLSLAIVGASLFEQASATVKDNHVHGKSYKHVAFFSIDGMHSSDVAKWVAMKPHGTIAKLLDSDTGIKAR